MKITIVKDRPSHSAYNLRNALRERGHTVRFTKEYPNKIIWGKPTNKLRQLQMFAVEGVRCVEWTLDPVVAQGWPIVYERHTLSGHSGNGIRISSGTVRNAPLYTKGVVGKRREYRVHVLGDNILVSQKKRRNGFDELPHRSDDIRNHHTGWVYTTQSMTPPPPQTEGLARDAVAALNLRYGAVDIICKDGISYVLEVNTAPGLEGTTLEFYADHFTDLLEEQQ